MSEGPGPSPAARWNLRLLGGFNLQRAEGGDCASHPTLLAKDRALLAYLALAPRNRQTRDHLADLLWPGRFKARGSLRTSLLNLRKFLGCNGDILVNEGDGAVHLAIDRFDVGVLLLGQLAAQGTRDALERAESLFAGELLEGFDIGNEDFEHWLAAERSRLRDRLVEVLSQLQRLRADAGEIDKAIETAKRLLRHYDLHEESYRLLMEMYRHTGRRWAALKIAEDCEETLRTHD